MSVPGEAAAGTLIEVDGLDAGYGPGRPALRGSTFSVPPAAMVAVLGPNGGGKTTLLRALLGQMPHRSGRVRVSGTPAYVPQTERARLDFPVGALDVVLMGAYAATPWYRRIPAGRRRDAQAALERVGLAGSERTRFGELSGGQRQRVLIARALVQGSEVILLDEPLSGVDRPSSLRILELLAELRSEGRAILVSTHDIEQSRLFDLVLCLNGEQIAFGEPEDVLTPDVLQRTYGGELIQIGDGQAVVVQHHDHEH